MYRGLYDAHGTGGARRPGRGARVGRIRQEATWSRSPVTCVLSALKGSGPRR